VIRAHLGGVLRQRPLEPHDALAEPSPSPETTGLVGYARRGAARAAGGLFEPLVLYAGRRTLWLHAKNKTLEASWPLAVVRSLAHSFATHDVRMLDWRRCARSALAQPSVPTERGTEMIPCGFLGDLEFNASGTQVTMILHRFRSWSLGGAHATTKDYKHRQRPSKSGSS
jgi:hypothetical protein